MNISLSASVHSRQTHKSEVLLTKVTFNYHFSSLIDNGIGMGIGLKYHPSQRDQDFNNPVFMGDDAWSGN